MKINGYFRDEVKRYEFCLIYYVLNGRRMNCSLLRKNLNNLSKIRERSMSSWLCCLNKLVSKGFLERHDEKVKRHYVANFEVNPKMKRVIQNEYKKEYENLLLEMK